MIILDQDGCVLVEMFFTARSEKSVSDTMTAGLNGCNSTNTKTNER